MTILRVLPLLILAFPLVSPNVFSQNKGERPNQARPSPTSSAPRSSVASIPPAVREEIERLSSPDPGKRGMAAASLGQMGPRAAPAIPYLIALLDDSAEVIVFGTELSGKTTVGEVALVTLRGLGEPAVDECIRALGAPQPRLRENAARALGRWKTSRALDALVVSLNDGGLPSSARGAAARALGNIGDGRAVPALIAAIGTKEIATEAVLALGKIKDERAVEPLVAAIGAPDPLGPTRDLPWRGAIAEVLAEINDPRAIEPLILYYERHETAVWNFFSGQAAIKKLTGQTFSTAKEARSWWQANKDRFNKP